ncbi:copper chaperone PCu(A)C [Devosia rhodophyticola]|uniref:Copper chaperone PCu(A)C n=1 Tax=Devosia rhodophyticola TaxID=3026423 RepID=A0ABY7YZW3_9HYPH|nr:copper chaperone PCu(A)C [Devosia rhodophyticola]WDR06796.1 copper chaperone PCu(A)C [Devosia rhodophyticola]
MIRTLFAAAFAVTLVFAPAAFAPAAFAHDGKAHFGDLDLSGMFARATLPNAPVGGGFLTITNHGSDADTLVSATSTAAKSVQVHEMKMEGDVMKMRHLGDGLPIPAGETVSLTPSGLHLMFMGLEQPFVEGATVPVTLTFANAGSVEVALPVLSVAATGVTRTHGPRCHGFG